MGAQPPEAQVTVTVTRLWPVSVTVTTGGHSGSGTDGVCAGRVSGVGGSWPHGLYLLCLHDLTPALP